MRFGGLLLALQCACVLAYRIVEGTIKVGDETIAFGEFNAQVVTPLAIGPRDTLEISVKIDELVTKPHQSVVTISNGKGLQYLLVPTVSPASNRVSLSIPVASLPNALKVEDHLFVKLILADAESARQDASLFQLLAEVQPSDELKSTTPHRAAERIGIKPEIHHVFKQDPATVEPVIPILFIFGVMFLSLGLLVAWVSVIGVNLLNHVSSLSAGQLACDVAFLASIVGYEATFVLYYLGSSIFTMLFYSAILSGPTIYFGSRTLRHLATNRQLDK